MVVDSMVEATVHTSQPVGSRLVHSLGDRGHISVDEVRSSTGRDQLGQVTVFVDNGRELMAFSCHLGSLNVTFDEMRAAHVLLVLGKHAVAVD